MSYALLALQEPYSLSVLIYAAPALTLSKQTDGWTRCVLEFSTCKTSYIWSQ